MGLQQSSRAAHAERAAHQESLVQGADLQQHVGGRLRWRALCFRLRASALCRGRAGPAAAVAAQLSSCPPQHIQHLMRLHGCVQRSVLEAVAVGGGSS